MPLQALQLEAFREDHQPRRNGVFAQMAFFGLSLGIKLAVCPLQYSDRER